jgi:hypothetical protein
MSVADRAPTALRSEQLLVGDAANTASPSAIRFDAVLNAGLAIAIAVARSSLAALCAPAFSDLAVSPRSLIRRVLCSLHRIDFSPMPLLPYARVSAGLA